MALLVWQNKFTVGVQKFDDAHKKLIDYINELFDTIKHKGTRDEVFRVLKNLESYTVLHFSQEEQEMENIGYRQLDEHKEQHRKLISELTDLKEQLQSGSELTNIKLLYFLKNWLTNHIMEIDQRYSGDMNKAGVS